jgi:predicted nucleic acid-binding protein
MSLLNFPSDQRVVLVADASVIINLVATGRAAEIIRALPNRMAVTANARAELAFGTRNGHDDAEQLDRMIAEGLVDPIGFGSQGASIYETLIGGSARYTLDDGEAATIASAWEASGVALIDERKARNLCAASYPQLIVVCTAEILMHDRVLAAVGTEGQVEILVQALQKGRMRVPGEHLAAVTRIIGQANAATCLSLPKTARAS